MSNKVIEELKKVYDVCNIERGRHGILSFDEVKVKEGVVLDPHTLSFVGENQREIHNSKFILMNFWPIFK